MNNFDTVFEYSKSGSDVLRDISPLSSEVGVQFSGRTSLRTFQTLSLSVSIHIVAIETSSPRKLGGGTKTRVRLLGETLGIPDDTSNLVRFRTSFAGTAFEKLALVIFKVKREYICGGFTNIVKMSSVNRDTYMDIFEKEKGRFIYRVTFLRLQCQ